jgi:hypothetical protein
MVFYCDFSNDYNTHFPIKKVYYDGDNPNKKKSGSPSPFFFFFKIFQSPKVPKSALLRPRPSAYLAAGATSMAMTMAETRANECEIPAAPWTMSHLSAPHWGATAMNGCIRNPATVQSAQKCAYRCVEK